MNNPFRHWDDNEFIPQTAYKKILNTYKNMKKHMKEVDDKEKTIEIAIEYIKVFNQLNSKYDEFIETEEREDIFAAMEQIYKECIQQKNIISIGELFDVMDHERDDW